MKIIHREYLDTPTLTVHAATIAFFNDEPAIAWFGGKREGMPDSAIYWQYKDGKGGIGNDAVARWNPIFFPYQDRLYLFVKIGTFCDRWQTLIYDMTERVDGGEAVDPQFLPAGLNGPVKTKPIVYEDRIYCGSSVETQWDWTSYVEMYKVIDGKFKYMARTDPLSVEKKVTVLPPYNRKGLTQGVIQPALWIDPDEYSLQMMLRSSHGLNKVYHAHGSLSCASSFVGPYPIEHLDNPNSGIDTLYVDETKKLYLVHNPSAELRSPLVISQIDPDNFEVYDQLVITEMAIAGTFSPELSYPYIVEHNGIFHLVYTHGRSKIEYVQIDPE